MGFLTAVDIDIIPYKPYLKLTYYPVDTLTEVVDVFARETNDPEVDSVEGIMYSLDRGVIMSGVFVHESDVERSKVNRLGRWYKPWFYKHVETFMTNPDDDSPSGQQAKVEYIPTVDFYHRYVQCKVLLFKTKLVFSSSSGTTNRTSG